MMCPTDTSNASISPDLIFALSLPTVPELSLARSASLFSDEYNVDSAMI